MSAREIRAPRGTELTLPVVAAGGRDADADEQPRPRGRRAARRTSSSTAARAGRRAPGRRSTRSCGRSARSPTTRRCSCSRASRSRVFRTHDQAPRVLISNSMLVPKWADWDTFRALEAQGLTMYGQMTAGSWIYIGTQGILQGTYETLAECAHAALRRARSQGTVTLTGGLGGMGGAQPLAVTMNDGVALCVEVDPIADRAPDQDPVPRPRDRRPRRGAARGPTRRRRHGERRLDRARSATAPRCCPSSCAAGGGPTSSPTRRAPTIPLGGYVPGGLSLDEAAALRRDDPDEYVRRAYASMAAPRRGDGGVPGRRRGHVRLREQPAGRRGAGRARPRPRVRVPGVRAGVRAAAVLRGQGAVPVGGALGRPGRHRRRPTARWASCSPRTSACSGGCGWPRSGWRSRGCPARICWLGYGERDRAGERFNELVASGERARADRDRSRPPGQRLAWRARTARPRRCATAPTRSPTGRS